jgi:glycosyltransferase involved in cell wall biosynthesis
MNQPIRVMQIIDSMGFGGAEVLLRDLTFSLLTSDYRVSVCYNTNGPIAKEIEAMGVPITRLPRLGRVDPTLLWRIYREIKKVKPDIVHTHLFKSDLHGRLAARLAGIPVVISTLHNCHNWAKNPILGRVYGANARLADHIIAVSNEVRDYSIRYSHIDPKKITTIANAVPLARFRDNRSFRAKIRQEFNISLEAPVIGIIARLTEQKDHGNFLRAAQIILKSTPETIFLIVGDGPLGDTLKEFAISLGIQNSVIFCGARQDVPAVMGTLDILVFSSRWEGLPVALLEGLASSLPVVATSVGGIPGVIQNGFTGFLVPPADSNALASSCISLINDAALRERIARAGYDHVQANYSMESMVSKTILLYQSLLQSLAI